MLINVRMGNSINERSFLFGSANNAANRLVRIWIGQGIKPEVFRGPSGLVPRLTISVRLPGNASQLLRFGSRRKDKRCRSRYGCERAGPPSNMALLYRKTAQDGGGGYGSIRIFETVIRHQLAQLVAERIAASGYIAGKICQSLLVVGFAIFHNM